MLVLYFYIQAKMSWKFEIENFRDAEAAVAAFIDGVRDLEPTDFSKVFDWISTTGKEKNNKICITSLFAIL